MEPNTLNLSHPRPDQVAGDRQPAAAAVVDLDQYRRSPTRDGALRWPRCPNRPGLEVLDRRTGLLVPARCDRLTCFACIVPVAIRTGEALALAKPESWITLTGFKGAWATTKRGMQRFLERVRGQRIQGQLAYHVEPNPRGGGAHVHGWWWGDPLPRDAVAEAVHSAKIGPYFEIGEAFIPREMARPSLEYGMKMVIKTMDADSSALSSEAEQFLNLNGGRLVHNSQGFFRDESGRPLAGLQAARRAVSSSSPGRWVTTTVAS